MASQSSKPPSHDPLRPRKLLAVSLLLLYVSFILFGWQWATLGQLWRLRWPLRLYPQLFWPLGLGLTFAVTGLFTKPLSSLRNWFKQLFESDTRLFFAVLFMTSVGVLLLVNPAVLGEGLLMLGVTWLARFDLRLAGIRGWRQFVILSAIAGVGLVGGGLLYWSWHEFGLLEIQQLFNRD